MIIIVNFKLVSRAELAIILTKNFAKTFRFCFDAESFTFYIINILVNVTTVLWWKGCMAEMQCEDGTIKRNINRTAMNWHLAYTTID